MKLQHLSGPIGIVRIYYLLFESDHGWQLALWFSVILNVNLAILNMLPIPVLDGGHIVLALIEAVRRKPVNMRVLEIGPDRLRGAHHRLHALRQLLRCRRFAWRNSDESWPASQRRRRPSRSARGGADSQVAGHERSHDTPLRLTAIAW